MENYTAFEKNKMLATGPLGEVAIKVKRRLKIDATTSILVFSDSTGKVMDLDLRGTETEIRDRLKVFIAAETGTPLPTGPGRPKLGVVAREVSLLPRHWEWLATQSGGASATLRRLVDEAKKSTAGRERVKISQERTYKFMHALAGDLADYESALRALYARERKKFKALIRGWPKDIRDHAKKLAEDVWD